MPSVALIAHGQNRRGAAHERSCTVWENDDSLFGFAPAARILLIRHLAQARALRMTCSWGGAVELSASRYSILVPITGQLLLAQANTETSIRAPAAVLAGPADVHRFHAAPCGAELIVLEFEPAWLRGLNILPKGTRSWTGGRTASAARELACAWSRGTPTDDVLGGATATFIDRALSQSEEEPPAWLNEVRSALVCHTPPTTEDLARALGLHPAWLARVYRCVVGEGIKETIRRKRVDAAILLLRDTNWRLAEVAVAAGFCDQSHMNRCFRTILGRTPLQVRLESQRLPSLHVAA